MKIKELYAKVAADAALQEVFAKILAETANDTDTQGKKLVEFAKGLGYDVTVEEIAEFFAAQAEKNGELAEEDLDAVAGGKSPGGIDTSAIRPSIKPGGCGIFIDPPVSVVLGCKIGF